MSSHCHIIASLLFFTLLNCYIKFFAFGLCKLISWLNIARNIPFDSIGSTPFHVLCHMAKTRRYGKVGFCRPSLHFHILNAIKRICGMA